MQDSLLLLSTHIEKMEWDTVTRTQALFQTKDVMLHLLKKTDGNTHLLLYCIQTKKKKKSKLKLLRQTSKALIWLLD